MLYERICLKGEYVSLVVLDDAIVLLRHLGLVYEQQQFGLERVVLRLCGLAVLILCTLRAFFQYQFQCVFRLCA